MASAIVGWSVGQEEQSAAVRGPFRVMRHEHLFEPRRTRNPARAPISAERPAELIDRAAAEFAALLAVRLDSSATAWNGPRSPGRS